MSLPALRSWLLGRGPICHTELHQGDTNGLAAWHSRETGHHSPNAHIPSHPMKQGNT